MSVLTDVLTGAAGSLAAAGLGIYDPARVWTATDTATAITLTRMPSQPDAVITLSVYLLGADDPRNPTTTVNIQARTRIAGLDPLPLLDVDWAIYVLWHGESDLTWGSVVVTQLMRKSSVGIGPDSNNRLMRSANFTADCDVPATALRHY